MAKGKAQKSRFNLFGYGAIALYAFVLAVVAAGIYGFNVSSLSLRNGEETRARVRTGRMVVTTTDDRTRCRSIHFNNETSELSKEIVVDCDDVTSEDRSSGGSFSMFRDGFVHR